MDEFLLNLTRVRDILSELVIEACDPNHNNAYFKANPDYSIDVYAISAYSKPMEFIETQTFTRLITSLLPDDDYRLLQTELVEDPERGALIKQGGGIRKVRFAAQGKGKSGGIRVIYYWLSEDNQIYMLLAYPKSKKDTLSDEETKILRDLVKEL